MRAQPPQRFGVAMWLMDWPDSGSAPGLHRHDARTNGVRGTFGIEFPHKLDELGGLHDKHGPLEPFTDFVETAI